MITRQIARRHGRALVVPRLARPQIHLRRTYAQEVDRVEHSIDNTLRGTHSIERVIASVSSRPVPKIEDQTYGRLDPETSRIAEKYKIMSHHNATTGYYGAAIGKHYRPNDVLNNPPSPSALTPELLLASQAHMGHSTSLWNPMNSKYIHGVREGIHIISLEETAAHLRLACKVVSGVAERGGLILFAGTKRGQDRSVVLAAKLSKGYHLFNRWMAGSITNKEQILGSYQLKMVDEKDRELVVNPEVLRQASAPKPDLVVCLNPMENWVLLHECSLNNIPTIGVIDTDADPTWVTYPIPANDDSLRCTNLIAGMLGRAGEEGQRIRMERTTRGDIPYEPFDLPADDAVGELYSMRLDADKEHEYDVEYRDENNQPMTREEFDEEQRQGTFVDDSMMTVYMDGDVGDVRDEKPYFFDERTGEAVQQHWPAFNELRDQGRQLPQTLVRQKPVEGIDVRARPSEAFAQELVASRRDNQISAEQATAAVQEKMEDREEAEAIEAANKVPEDRQQKEVDDEKKAKSH